VTSSGPAMNNETILAAVRAQRYLSGVAAASSDSTVCGWFAALAAADPPAPMSCQYAVSKDV
jgi:hypothetical protein